MESSSIAELKSQLEAAQEAVRELLKMRAEMMEQLERQKHYIIILARRAGLYIPEMLEP